MKSAECKDKNWEAPDYHRLVIKLAERCLRLIEKETKGFDPKGRWLVFGRVALVIFQNHFGMSIAEASKVQRNGETGASSDNTDASRHRIARG